MHTAPNESFTCPVFTPDGRSLITRGWNRDWDRDTSAHCFDIRDLTAASEPRRRLVGDWGGIWEFDISPDGRTIAAISDRVYEGGRAVPVPDRRIRVAMRGSIDLVDIPTGRLRLVLGSRGLSIRSQAFSPDSKYLAVGFDDGTVRVYDTTDGRERLPRMAHRVPVGPPPPMHDLEEGRRAQASVVPPRLPMSSSYVNWLEVIDALEFSPDGKILAGGSRLAAMTPSPGSLFFWDFARGKELRRVEGFPAGPTSLAFSADGRTIAVAGTSEPRPRIWEVATGREMLPQAGHLRAILALAISPKDGTVFTGGRDDTVRRWDAATGRELGIVARFEGRTVDRLAIAPDGRTLVIQGNFGDPIVWSVAEGRELAHLAGFAGGPPLLFPISCSPDGRSVLFGRTIWDLATGQRRAELHKRGDPGPGNVWVSWYHPDGRRILSTGPGFVWAWDAATGDDQGVLLRNEALRYGLAVISPDGRMLATSDFFQLTDPEPAERWIHLWDLSTGREAARLPAHGGAGRGLAFSPDGRLLAEFRSDQSVIRNASSPDPHEPAIWIWDVVTRRELRAFNGHRGRVNAAAFTPRRPRHDYGRR
ncbi:MAG: WD40 repeat domain-containing protein [Isosphaeraceae bacterium]